MPVVVNPYIMEWFVDKSEERHFDTAIDVAIGTGLHFAADARRYTQSKAFDLGVWYTKNILPEVVERADDYFCPSAAWGCWIPGMVVGTIGLAAAWSPLFATTLMAYTNPYTVGPAFAIDAYNIYRYFD